MDGSAELGMMLDSKDVDITMDSENVDPVIDSEKEGSGSITDVEELGSRLDSDEVTNSSEEGLELLSTAVLELLTGHVYAVVTNGGGTCGST